jgi:hypothetical protein
MKINNWIDAESGHQSRIYDQNKADHNLVILILLANGLQLDEIDINVLYEAYCEDIMRLLRKHD